MGSFGTNVSPSHFVEVADPANPGQTKRPAAGATLQARDAITNDGLAPITTAQYGYWSASYPGVDVILVSGDSGETWVGPLLSGEAELASTQAGQDASAARVLAQQAKDSTTVLGERIDGLAAPAWGSIAGKPATFPPSAHGHAASGVTVTPTGSMTATNVQDALQQLLGMGGGGGGPTPIRSYVYRNAQWVDAAGATIPTTAPAGTSLRFLTGPSQAVDVPDWAGVPTFYIYAQDY